MHGFGGSTVREPDGDLARVAPHLERAAPQQERRLRRSTEPSRSRGATAIGTTGRPFTEDNIGDALATRALLSDLRGAGEVTKGPPPFSPRDRSQFRP